MTQGLRSLQQKSELFTLLSSVLAHRNSLFSSSSSSSSLSTASASARPVPPLLVKIAPDLSEEAKDDIADVVLRSGVDGIIISNTTLARPKELKSPQRNESGGLSGAPLKQISTQLIAEMYRKTKGKVVIIGVGGVENGQDAYNKIKAVSNTNHHCI